VVYWFKSSFKSLTTLWLISAIVTVSGCKSEESKLASVDACTEFELSQLKHTLYQLEVAAGERESDGREWRQRGAFELTTDSSAESLVRTYTLNYSSKLPRDGFDRALAMAPAEGWQDSLTGSCMAYAVTYAENKCGFLGCGWGGVNKNHPSYMEYRSSASASCSRAFNDYVASRQSVQNDGANNNIAATDNNDIKGDKDSEREAYKARMRAKIPGIKAKIAACEKYLSSNKNPPLGEQPSDWFEPTNESGADSSAGGGNSDGISKNDLGQDIPGRPSPQASPNPAPQISQILDCNRDYSEIRAGGQGICRNSSSGFCYRYSQGDVRYSLGQTSCQSSTNPAPVISPSSQPHQLIDCNLNFSQISAGGSGICRNSSSGFCYRYSNRNVQYGLGKVSCQ
jgi:hypothetical protein